MNKIKRMVDKDLERKSFEDLLDITLMRYKDNLICSEETKKILISEMSKLIRQQLKGVHRKEDE